MKRYLIKFDFGLRYAFGESIEICNEEDLQMLKDFSTSRKTVNLGEIEGKHSEVYGTLDAGDWEIISEDENDIAVIEKVLGNNWGAFCIICSIYDTLNEG